MLKIVKRTRIEIREEIEVWEDETPGEVASIAFYFSGETMNPQLLVSLSLGLFTLASPVYVKADGTQALNSDGTAIPIVGPLTAVPIDPTVTAVVNSDNSISFQMPDTYKVGQQFTVLVTDATPGTPFTGTIIATALGAVPEGPITGLGFVFTGPFTSAQTA
jgi:hypothetical protein